MIIPCCDLFLTMITDAGKAGLSAIVRQVGDTPKVFLQHRICDFGKEASLVVPKPQTADCRKMTIVSQSGISYCPFCGESLEELLDKNLNNLRDIIELHRSFSIEVW